MTDSSGRIHCLAEANEPMVAVKRFCLFALGIVHQGEHRNLCPRGAGQGIPQQSAAQPAALIALIDGKTA